ncbi:hypothetical protein TSOC_009585 [Tetrabaena socialis]|uniref:Uncharacterized protein n=1 Tax=Tetrabaena socialis TaxID=47790 RepID=A0A2J7ZVK1_9CHLO|nr:hypothetical protein TSOC_009585 [Tetrabaena socialis]|eukprot:PNH04268.1 hypothetical protein TSOC_009585 [Tetrabaena socialis]
MSEYGRAKAVQLRRESVGVCSSAQRRGSGGGHGTTTPVTRPSAIRNHGSGGSRGSGSGSGGAFLNKAINQELQQCRSLDDLDAVLSSHASDFDSINVCTAWLQLAKLKPWVTPQHGQYATMPPEVAPFVRLLVGKTLANVHRMGMREVTNILWSMGKLSVQLESQPNGHYLAELIEQRLLEVAGEGGLADARHAEQLWYSFATSKLTGLYR